MIYTQSFTQNYYLLRILSTRILTSASQKKRERKCGYCKHELINRVFLKYSTKQAFFIKKSRGVLSQSSQS